MAGNLMILRCVMKGRVNNPLLLSDLSKALAYAIDGRLVQAVDITQTSVTSDYPLTYEQVLTVFFTITGYNEGTYFRAIMNGETQDFVFPKSYTYPPMWSMQRVGATRERQYKRWSGIILAYCRNARIWRFRLVEMLDTPLFHNKELKEWLSLQEVRDIVDWMSREEGLKRAEWIGNGSDKSVAWIYWRRPDEWAEIIWKWVEESGQKNTVFTLFELTQGESTASQEFFTMDPDVLQKALQILVKRGKASIFGSQDELGVKFF